MLPVTSGITKAGATGSSTDIGTSIPFTSVGAADTNNTTSTAPKAYLTVLFFDERFRFVEEGSMSVRVQENPGFNASLTCKLPLF